MASFRFAVHSALLAISASSAIAQKSSTLPDVYSFTAPQGFSENISQTNGSLNLHSPLWSLSQTGKLTQVAHRLAYVPHTYSPPSECSDDGGHPGGWSCPDHTLIAELPDRHSREDTTVDQQAAARDPEAVELLTRSLEAMGGQSKWIQVQSIQVNGTISIGKQSTASSFTWSDDLRNGTATRLNSIGNGATNNADGSVNAPLRQEPDSNRTSIRPNRFNLLLAHAPAAALQIAMSDSKYTIVRSTQQGEQSVPCVLVALTANSLETGGVHTEICFSAQTNLPKYASVAMPPISRGREISFERIDYNSYERRDGLLFPSDVTAGFPTNTIHYVFKPYVAEEAVGGKREAK